MLWTFSSVVSVFLLLNLKIYFPFYGIKKRETFSFFPVIRSIFSLSVSPKKLSEQYLGKNLLISFIKVLFRTLLLSYKKCDSWKRSICSISYGTIESSIFKEKKSKIRPPLLFLNFCRIKSSFVKVIVIYFSSYSYKYSRENYSGDFFDKTFSNKFQF